MTVLSLLMLIICMRGLKKGKNTICTRIAFLFVKKTLFIVGNIILILILVGIEVSFSIGKTQNIPIPLWSIGIMIMDK